MSEASPSRMLVTGFSGTIGVALLPALQAQGWAVTRLVHGPARSAAQIQWDPEKPLASEMVAGFDAVIHLAGESIAGRWTESKKSRIRDSRVHGTEHLAQALARASRRPRVLIAASATGYYGDRGDEVLREQSPPGSGFLPKVCRAWEAATEAARDAGIRTVQIRTGIVLTPKGGALGQMLTPFKLGVGGRIGSGRQWWSWIHVQDLVAAIFHILRNDDLLGPLNMVSPAPETNTEFTKILASVLRRPALFPAPAFALRIALGQMADEALLASARVEPVKLIASGFNFQYPKLQAALASLVS